MAPILTETVPKYVRIGQYVREGLANGLWKPGDRLPSCREFVDRFAVTPMTVWKALDELTREGLIRRVQGKGTFVSERPLRTGTRLVGVGSRTRGDSYGLTFEALTRHLKQHHFSALALGFDVMAQETQGERRRHLDALLSSELAALVMDGASYLPFAVLEELEDRLPPLTFTRVYESPRRLASANMIVSDWRMGGYISARHVLEAGHRKLTFVTFGEPTESPRRFGLPEQYNRQVADGIEQAIREAGGDPARDLRFVFDTVSRRYEPAVGDALADGYRGVICLGDVRAPKVYRAAARLGLEIGRDVGVCGFFDTPWSEQLDPPLTSVRIHEDRIGTLAATAVVEGWRGRRMDVTPEVVVRESTGGPASGVGRPEE